MQTGYDSAASVQSCEDKLENKSFSLPSEDCTNDENYFEQLEKSNETGSLEDMLEQISQLYHRISSRCSKHEGNYIMQSLAVNSGGHKTFLETFALVKSIQMQQNKQFEKTIFHNWFHEKRRKVKKPAHQYIVLSKRFSNNSPSGTICKFQWTS